MAPAITPLHNHPTSPTARRRGTIPSRRGRWGVAGLYHRSIKSQSLCLNLRVFGRLSLLNEDSFPEDGDKVLCDTRQLNMLCSFGDDDILTVALWVDSREQLMYITVCNIHSVACLEDRRIFKRCELPRFQPFWVRVRTHL